MRDGKRVRDHGEGADEVDSQDVDEVVDRHFVRELQVGPVEDAGRGHDASDAAELAFARATTVAAPARRPPTSQG